uniref:Uncharacterized protein n=1 Tax=Zea mays TaxID=4577 RepID=A0A804LIR4_MAIZE
MSRGPFARVTSSPCSSPRGRPGGCAEALAFLVGSWPLVRRGLAPGRQTARRPSTGDGTRKRQKKEMKNRMNCFLVSKSCSRFDDSKTDGLPLKKQIII